MGPESVGMGLGGSCSYRGPGRNVLRTARAKDASAPQLLALPGSLHSQLPIVLYGYMQDLLSQALAFPGFCSRTSQVHVATNTAQRGKTAPRAEAAKSKDPPHTLV